MPTYEYVCTSCENHWEEVQKISEPALESCPKCSNKTAKRQISGGNFILKGGGWYADLYSSPSAKKDDAKTEKAEAKGGEKTETKSGEKSGEKGGEKSAKTNGGTPAAKSSPPPAKTESSSSSSSSPSSTSGSSGSKT